MGGVIVAVSFEDPDARRDDIPWKVGDEQYVAVHEVVVGDVSFKVGTGN